MMAQAQLDVLSELGFNKFHVVGHDRGGRFAHCLARDHTEHVLTVTVMDFQPKTIAPPSAATWITRVPARSIRHPTSLFTVVISAEN
jgi:pimeloyl-ACP methyl ester carboxylesterase